MSLPPRFHRYFWDADKTVLDTREHPHYIIERLLERGNIEALRWLLATFPREAIIDVLKTSSALSLKSGNFWALYFQIDPFELLCMKKSSLEEPRASWRA